MLVLTRRSATWFLGPALAISLAGELCAQLVPRRGGHYGGGYEDWGTLGALTAAYSSAAQQCAYMEDRQLQAVGTMARSAAWQQINRSVAAENAARNRGFDDAGQSARDWVFAHQPALHLGPLAAGPAPPTAPHIETAPASEAPAAPADGPPSQDMLRWPTLLNTAPFAELRAEVEAPFRRARAGHRPLAAADYRSVIQALTTMRSRVVAMKAQILSREYTMVLAYVDALLSDAQRRLDARAGASTSTPDR